MHNEIDSNRLYQHILNLQGIKHANIDYKALSNAADYIKSEFEKLGLDVIEEKFKVDGLDYEFRNIVGVLKRGDANEIVISGHHDTVFNSPGANDNASACAVILEIARVLSTRNLDNINFRFVSFDLEETNPYIEQELNRIAEKHAFKINNIHTKLIYRENQKKYLPTMRPILTEKGRIELLHRIEDLSEPEIAYYTDIVEFASRELIDEDWVGKTALMGSANYVRNAIKEGRKIRGIINLDTVGYSSENKGSQIFPEAYPVKLMQLMTRKIGRLIPKISRIFRFQGVKDISVGNYALLLADDNSNDLAKVFLDNAKQVDLNMGAIQTQMNYDQIKQQMPDLLRSDHAPFWREGIDGIFITDTANFRYHYYHTSADEIEYINFDFLKKITQTTLLTALEYACNPK